MCIRDSSCLAPTVFSVLCPHGIPLGKCAVHRFDNLIRLVVFDFGVNIHRDFTALVTCQVLHRFGVNRGMNQVGYVCVPELVGSDLEIQAVNTVTVVPGLLSQLWVCLLYTSRCV